MLKVSCLFLSDYLTKFTLKPVGKGENKKNICGCRNMPSVFGVFFFREKNIKDKAIDLILVLIGMYFLYLGSR